LKKWFVLSPGAEEQALLGRRKKAAWKPETKTARPAAEPSDGSRPGTGLQEGEFRQYRLPHAVKKKQTSEHKEGVLESGSARMPSGPWPAANRPRSQLAAWQQKRLGVIQELARGKMQRRDTRKRDRTRRRGIAARTCGQPRYSLKVEGKGEPGTTVKSRRFIAKNCGTKGKSA